MKLDTKGILFRVWRTVFLLAAGITVFIGMLQIGLIRPYYRNNIVSSVKLVADTVQNSLILSDAGKEQTETALREVIDNNVCLVIYNDRANIIYEADSLGTGCIFNAPATSQMNVYRSGTSMLELLASSGGEYSENVSNSRTGLEMIVYGRTIRDELSNYYLFVNSPVEPVDSIVTFFFRQYILYTLIAIVFASVVSYAIARSISDPIVRMRREAGKLARADYSANFEGGRYTETAELASTLNDARDKLAKIDQLRRDLIANVSHDIRTPITDIRAYAEMIRDISGNDPVKRQKHLDVIIRETQYMNNLVTDMSELSKMQSGNYHLNIEEVDLASVIRDIVGIYRQTMEKAMIRIKEEFTDDLIIYADEIKISQVVSNYISNAVKHSPDRGTITVRAYFKEDGHTVRFEVQDEGDGISAEDMPYIWDRYNKFSRNFSRSMTNTGLGLAIVKAILDAHMAPYGVESDVGKGSLFWFELNGKHAD